MATIGRNISFPIYNGDGTSFHDLVMKRATYDSIVMSLGDKITGDVYYKDNTLVTNQDIYIVYNGVHYTLVNPPTIVREGMASENGELKGMTKYSFEFYHPMYQLNNFPFSDIAVTSSQGKYLSQNKTFAWIGDLYDYVDKINVNLEETVWCCEIGSSVQEVDKAKLSDVLSFNNQTIADALKTGYETWEIPYVISQLPSTDTRYSRDGKRFLITFGLPSTEIIGANNQPYVFRFGQGVGLKNNSRTPRNNKIVTRLAGYGSENNIPWGYPQIIWTGDASWNYTIGNDPTDPNSYPIYDGIVNGERVRLIKHPFTRNHLMPSIYAETVNRKVNPNARGYDPDTVIIDYYDADDEEEFENIINSDAPSYEIHEFEDIKPELGEQYLVDVSAYDANAITLSECKSMVLDYYSESNIEAEKTQLLALYNALPNTASSSGSSGVYKYDWSIANDGDYLLVKYKSSGVNFEHKVTRQVTPDWDDSIDDDGNYKQSYFKVTLPELGFDLYACAALTEKMQINMRSGDCIGCTFDVMIDWDDYKKNFYTEDGKFDPVIGTGHPRNGTKYPDSTNDEITLIVQKDNNTFGIIMPNIYQQPTSRDKFVILGISLPLAYITDAEERLDADMIQYMKDNNVFYFDYPLKFDENFLYRNTDILAQMKPNVIVRFEYAGIVNALYIKQMSIKYGQGVLPQYDITLTDDVEIVLNKIGQVTDEVSKLRLMMGEGGDANVAELDKRYLSKRNDDTAEGMIRMTKGLYVGNNFVTGLLGEGGVMRMDNDGTTYLEVDKMYVRMRAYFDTVEVRRFLHSGGNRIASLAGMKCTRVEYINSSGNVTKDASSAVKFRCYFRANDDGNAVTNDFVVGDLAFCKETNADTQSINQHGYWRAVVGKSSTPNSKGEHWIDLSASDCLSGSDIPIAQDDIIQLGNKTDTTRQGAIIEYVGGADAPAYQIYQGINSYSLEAKNYVRFGYDSQSGSAQAYIGNPDGSTYLWYHNVTEGGQTFPRLDIKANVIFQSPTTHQDTTIENFATIVTNDIDNIQAQIDGQIESWFYDYMPVQETSGAPANRIPLTNKEPYKTWYEADNGGTASEVTTERTKHLGDTFYDNSSGYAFRFSLNTTVTPNVFEWVVIEDSAVIKALKDAANAQDTADHKRRVFLSQPTPPYDEGDLWAQGENGDLFMCTTSRQSGNYVPSDWELATKYTDDTKYNSFITRLLNGMPSGSDETSVTNALNAIKGAYNQGTEVHGGLVLTSLIGLLDSNGDTQAGISGQYSSTAFGNGLAFWAGGGMIDKRNSSTGAYDVADGAKIGLRFDGSGYVANGNLFWNANGDVNIQGYSINATTLQVGGKGVATAEALANYLPLAGGTMKGDIKVDNDNSRTLGAAAKRWKNIYSISAVVKNASTNNDGSFIEIGQIRLVYDHNNNALKVVKNDGTSNANFYATGTVSALGANSQGGGGGGVELSAVWQSLMNNDDDFANNKINIAHIPDLSNLTLSYGKSGAVTSSVVYNGKAGKTVFIPQKLSDLSDGNTIVTKVEWGGTSGDYANKIKVTTGTSTISGFTVGYATKAGQWNTSRNFTIKDSDQSHSGTAASVNGAAAVTLLLPSTIKATLVGNADTATKATQDGNGNNIASTYATVSSLSGYATGLAVGTGNNSTKITVVKNGSADANGYITVPFATNSTNATSSTGLVSTTMPSGANYDDYSSFTNCRVYDNSNGYENIPNIGKYSTLVSLGKGMRTFQIRADHYSTFLAYRVLQNNGASAEVQYTFTDWREILHSYAATLNNTIALCLKDASGTARRALSLSIDNDFLIGYGTSGAGYNTYIDGNNIYLRYGTEHTTGITLASSGSVTVAQVLNANGGIVVPSNKSIKIGNAVLSWDGTNNCLKVSDGTANATTKIGIYATGTVSALGANTSGGGGTGIEMQQVWEALAQAGNNEPINYTHIQSALTNNGYMHSFSKTNPAGATVVTDVNYNTGTGTLSVTRGSLAINALAPKDIPTTLATFYDGDNLIYTRVGGSNSVADKPSGVDAFGVITMRTANGYYGQILYGANGHIYYRSAATSSLGGTAWNTLLGTLNYKSYTYDKTATYNKNMVLASSATTDGQMATFRELVAADIPNLNASKITAGTLAIARGGTGAATTSPHFVFIGASSGTASAPSFRALEAADLPDLSGTYLPLDGSKAMTGILNTCRKNGSWIIGKTQAAIMYNSGTPLANASTSEWLFNMVSSSGNTIAFGGLKDTIGFYGWLSDRTANGTDWGTTFNTSNGVLSVTTINGVNPNLILNKTTTTEQDTPAQIRFVVTDSTTGKSTGTFCFISVYNDHDTSSTTSTTYGGNMLLQSGGGVFIGGGEAPQNHYDAKKVAGTPVASENMYITSDTVTFIQSNASSIANRVGFYVSKAGDLIPCAADVATSRGNIGSNDYKWSNLYISNSVKIGNCTISWDNTNNLLKFSTGIYSEGTVSALGANNNSSGGGGADIDDVWDALARPDSSKLIDSSHINITAIGDGNAVTGVTGSGTSITLNKGTSFLPLGAGSGNALTGDLYLNQNLQLVNGKSVIGKITNGTTGSILTVSGNNLNIGEGFKATSSVNTNIYTGNQIIFYKNASIIAKIASDGYILCSGYMTADGTSTQLLRANGSAAALAATEIPDLDASKITSGTLSADRLPAMTGLFTSLSTSYSTNPLSITIGGTTRNLSELYTTGIINKLMASGDNYSDYSQQRYSYVACNLSSISTIPDIGSYDTLMSFGYNLRTAQFLATHYSTALKYRVLESKGNGTYGFCDWRTILHTANYSSYAVTLSTAQTITGQKTIQANVLASNSGSTAGSTYYYNFGSRSNYFGSFFLRDITLVDTTTNEDMFFGWRSVTINGTSKRVFTMYAYETTYSDIILGHSGASSGGGIFYKAVGNYVGIGTYTPSYKLHVSGDVYSSSEMIAASDARSKNVIEDTKLKVKDIALAPSVRYTWKDKRDEKVHIGSIAQYWEKALPEAVSYDGNGIMSLNYGALALVSAITIAKELLKYESRLSKLERENKKLKERISALERSAA